VPLKILHVITDLKMGGESKHLVRAISSLDAWEHVVSCLTVTTDPDAAPASVLAEIEELGVRVVDLGVSPGDPISVPRGAIRLIRLARTEQPDLVHSTLIHANQLSQPLSWLGFPLICSLVVTDPWRRNWQRIFDRHAGRRAIFLANSRAVAASLVGGGLDRGRVRFLHYGVDCEHFRPDGPRAELAGDPIVLGLGRLHRQKAFEDLLFAAGRLAARPSVVLVGDGPLRGRLTRVADELGVGLTIVPSVRDVAPYLRRANVVALPSLYEGLPNVLLEALGTGCAVVASDLPGHREVLRDGENGILVAPSDVEGLAKALGRALRDDGSLGAAGREMILAHFQWDEYVERRRLLYESVAMQRRRTARAQRRRLPLGA
jgi:glycosyltransferase involved in cell wall biosynthesis